jgi:glycosyltransferase involved in cell wall biosynthesis
MNIVLTQAYNAAETIDATVQSVLSQSATDLEYHIIDSASTDDTWQCILDYAKKDRRVVPVRRRVNHLESFSEYIENTLLRDSELRDSTNLTIVDADDTLTPNALEILSAALIDEDADVAVGGYDKITRGMAFKSYVSPCLLQHEGMVNSIQLTHAFMMTTWCKLYPLHVLRKADLRKCRSMRIGGDTLFATEIFKQAKRVVFDDTTVYNYIDNPKSITKFFDVQRMDAPARIYNAFRSYCDMYAPLSEETQGKLYDIYLSEMMAIFLYVHAAPLSSARKKQLADALIMKELSHAALSHPCTDQKKLHAVAAQYMGLFPQEAGEK